MRLNVFLRAASTPRAASRGAKNTLDDERRNISALL